MEDLSKLTIPPLPQVIMNVMKYDLNSPNANPQEIEKIISFDKSITAEVLKVANSAYYGRSGKVKVLRDATALLGLKALKNLIIFLGTKAINQQIKLQNLKKYTNVLPTVAALISKQIANDIGKKEIEEEVFLVGLLHKIGISVLAISKSEHYSLLIEEAENSETDLIELERQAYQTDHQEIGQKIIKQWNLPDIYVKACGIGTHTKIEELKTVEERITFIATICAMEILHIFFEPSNYAKINQIFQSLGGKEDPVIKYASEEFFNKFISIHPLYQYSIG